MPLTCGRILTSSSCIRIIRIQEPPRPLPWRSGSPLSRCRGDKLGVGILLSAKLWERGLGVRGFPITKASRKPRTSSPALSNRQSLVSACSHPKDMAKPKVAAKHEKRPFEIHELFFSTTDQPGVIRSGNEVFRCVAAFDTLEEMIGKPHNIIRHPDMPRAVFKLLWDYLDEGKPICAYVKNQAQDGAYYWVFALVLPVPGGYLSVRFKPSSPIFKVVQSLYKAMRKIEIDTGNEPKIRDIGMKKAGEYLMAALQEKGFSDYDTFMRIALATEMGARAKKVASTNKIRSTAESDSEFSSILRECNRFEEILNRMFLQVETFLGLITRLEARSTFLNDLAENISLLSLNSLIACNKHGDQGLGLAVVAENLSGISKGGMKAIVEISDSIRSLVTALRESAFNISAAKLQVEISTVFLTELIELHDGASIQRHRDDLRMLAQSFARTVFDIEKTLPHLFDPLASLRHQLIELSGSMRALSRVHLIGRVEAAHIDKADTFLQLFNDVAVQLGAANLELHAFASEINLLRKDLPALVGDSSILHNELSSFHLAAA